MTDGTAFWAARHVYGATARGLALASGIALSACASLGGPPQEHDRPPYEGTCTLLGIEAAAGPSDHNDDAISVVASYRFDGPDVPKAKQPLSLVFRITRSRMDELRDHLQTHPAVLCSPDNLGASDVDVCVAPFEGQTGHSHP